MCDKITIIDRQENEMSVSLATVLATISSPGMAFKIVCLC